MIEFLNAIAENDQAGTALLLVFIHFVTLVPSVQLLADRWLKPTTFKRFDRLRPVFSVMALACSVASMVVVTFVTTPVGGVWAVALLMFMGMCLHLSALVNKLTMQWCQETLYETIRNVDAPDGDTDQHAVIQA